MCLELSEIKQSGLVDAKNTLGANVFIIFLIIIIIDSLWQRRESEVPSSELYIKP